MIANVIQVTCVLTNVANCKNECKGKCEHQKVCKSTVSKYVGGAEKAYQDITTNYDQHVWQLSVLNQQQKHLAS